MLSTVLYIIAILALAGAAFGVGGGTFHRVNLGWFGMLLFALAIFLGGPPVT